MKTYSQTEKNIAISILIKTIKGEDSIDQQTAQILFDMRSRQTANQIVNEIEIKHLKEKLLESKALIIVLRDKLSRRNMQIKDSKAQIVELTKPAENSGCCNCE